MKTIIMYYSHSGNTKALATKKAQELGADMEELIEIEKPFIPVGIYRAVNRVRAKIQPFQAELDEYDKIIIMSPVWAGHPVSAIYSLIDRLPSGKQVELIMTSGGGSTKNSTEGTKALVAERGCEVVGYADVVVKINAGTVEEIPVMPPDLSYLKPIAVAFGGAILLACGAYALTRKIKDK